MTHVCFNIDVRCSFPPRTSKDTTKWILQTAIASLRRSPVVFRPQQGLSECILFSSAATSTVDCSDGENFSIPSSYACGYTGNSPSSAGFSLRLARNQLSATEAACRSSRTLEGICQELHARTSRPYTRECQRHPICALRRPVSGASWESNALACDTHPGRDVSRTARDRYVSSRTCHRRRATINSVDT